MKKCLSLPSSLPDLSRKSEALSCHRRDGTSLTIATKTSGSQGPAYRREGEGVDQTDPAERSSLPPSISLPTEPLDFGLETEWRGPLALVTGLSVMSIWYLVIY